MLTQLLDFKLDQANFEQDFNRWEISKIKYEKQTGQALPDGVLIATLLIKTTGALQQHLRLNARTLQTYQQMRDTIVEYFRSKLILTPSPTSANSSFAGGGHAPMDIGFVGKKSKKGKGKGKKGTGKGPHWGYFGSLKGKSKGKGKETGKNFGSTAQASAKGSSSGGRQGTFLTSVL